MILSFRVAVISIFILLISQTLISQNTVGTISTNSDIADGYTLISIGLNSYLINNCGEVINEWNSNYLPGNAVYLLPNSNLLRAGRSNNGSTISMGGAGGVIEIFDWNGNLIWSYLYSGANFRQHHDVYPMPNGNVLILAANVMTQQEAIDEGRDPNMLPDGRLYNEQIIEVVPVGNDQANIVWEWNIKDHLIQDFDSSKDNFGIISNSPQKLDINFLNGGSGSENWLHFNSIQYDETLDQIVISARNLSEIYVIDHSTTTQEAAGSTGGIYGKGGDLLYRWGNPQAYQQGTEANRTLYGQHYPHYIKQGLNNAGKILLFNNGIQRTPSFSEVMIISPPTSSPGTYTKQSGLAYGPAFPDFVFSDTTENPSSFYSAIVSGAQQLPNGNILICEGRTGEIFELDSNNNIVWDYINPEGNSNNIGVVQGSEPPPDNLLFRAIKYPIDYPPFINNTISVGPPLEQNPNLANCQNILSLEDFQNVEVKIYPNPTSDEINIASDIHFDEVNLLNLNGEMIKRQYVNSKFDLSSLASGTYLLVLKKGNNKIVKKVIKN